MGLRRHRQQSVPISRQECGSLAADDPVGTALVVNDHRLPDCTLKLFRAESRQCVGDPRGGPRHDDLDRLVRILSLCGYREP